MIAFVLISGARGPRWSVCAAPRFEAAIRPLTAARRLDVEYLERYGKSARRHHTFEKPSRNWSRRLDVPAHLLPRLCAKSKAPISSSRPLHLSLFGAEAL